MSVFKKSPSPSSSSSSFSSSSSSSSSSSPSPSHHYSSSIYSDDPDKKRNAYHWQGVMELVAYATHSSRSTYQCRIKAMEIFNMEKLPPQSTISGMLKRNGVILKVDGGKGRNIKSQNSISKSAYVPTAPKTPSAPIPYSSPDLDLSVRVKSSKRRRFSNDPKFESLILSITYNTLLQGIIPTQDAVIQKARLFAIEQGETPTNSRSQINRIMDKYILTSPLKDVETKVLSKLEYIQLVSKAFPDINVSAFNVDNTTTPRSSKPCNSLFNNEYKYTSSEPSMPSTPASPIQDYNLQTSGVDYTHFDESLNDMLNISSSLSKFSPNVPTSIKLEPDLTPFFVQPNDTIHKPMALHPEQVLNRTCSPSEPRFATLDTTDLCVNSTSPFAKHQMISFQATQPPPSPISLFEVSYDEYYFPDPDSEDEQLVADQWQNLGNGIQFDSLFDV